VADPRHPAGPGSSPPAAVPPPSAPTRPDLARPGRFHVVGAGGSGMSAIATVLAAMGHDVTGSDQRDSAALARLDGAGVRTWVGHRPAALDGVDALTVSTAVPVDDAEVVEARRRGIPVYRRAEMLAAICATRRTLAVGGTHGKTTTSSMLAGILVGAGWRPSFIVGGDIAGIGPGARWDDGEWLVVEADESDGTFLELGAEGVVVTSVEPDHLDFYGSVERLEEAFEAFLVGSPGPRVVCVDGAEAAALAVRLTPRVPLTTYGSAPAPDGTAPAAAGSAPADLTISGLVGQRDSVRFEVSGPAGPLGTVRLGVPGAHNAQNAVGALALALAVGVDFDVAASALAAFAGVGRRFESRGERGGVSFVDDYGHLPGEVAVTVATALGGGWDRVVAVFQPHRYSRTAALWADFADAFIGVDVVVVTDVYPSGEAPLPGVTGALVADAVRRAHPDADVRYVPDRAALIAHLDGELRPGDVCLTLGAGDLTTLPDDLLVGGGEAAS
jgi:UDP-N-acetylmuramate--alanine ligase